MKFYYFIRNSSEIFGIIFSFCGISAFTGPFVIKSIIGESNDKILFHIIFLIGSLYQIICIIILFYFNEDKFGYKINNNDNKKSELKKIFIVPNIRM
jgi:hypothetical protein